MRETAEELIETPEVREELARTTGQKLVKRLKPMRVEP